MRRFTCLAASLLMMLLCGPVAFADTRNRQAAPPVYLVMDVSGSMAGERLAAAQTAAKEFVRGLEPNQIMALYTFPGGTKVVDGCPAGSFNIRPTRIKQGNAQHAINILSASGSTPTVPALKEIMRNVKNNGFEQAQVVLVTDGEANCGESNDVCSIVPLFQQQGINLKIHTVSLNNTPSGDAALACLARATGGTSSTVDDLGGLVEAVKRTSSYAATLSVDIPSAMSRITGQARELAPIVTITVTGVGSAQIPDATLIVTFASSDSARQVFLDPEGMLPLGNIDPGVTLTRQFRVYPRATSDGEVTWKATVLSGGLPVATASGRVHLISSSSLASAGHILRDAKHTVILGDSYSSGEGAGDYDPAITLNRDCHRSSRAYGRLLFPQATMVACSGAVTTHLFRYDEREPALTSVEPQLYELLKLSTTKSSPDLVLMTLGGNDAGFADVVTNLVTGLASPDSEPIRPAMEWSTLQSRLQMSYVYVNAVINSPAALAARDGKVAQIVILPYVRPIPSVGGDGCFVLLSRQELVLANDFLTSLNRTVRDAVEAADRLGVPIHLAAPVEYAFQPHQTICDGEDSWTNTISVHDAGQSANAIWRALPARSRQELMHPTAEGNAAIASSLVEWSRTVLPKRLVQPHEDFKQVAILTRRGWTTDLTGSRTWMMTPRFVHEPGDVIDAGWCEGECTFASNYVVVTSYSVPIPLGTLPVSLDTRRPYGVIALPLDLPPGHHTLVLRGYDAQGQIHEASIEIVVRRSGTNRGLLLLGIGAGSLVISLGMMLGLRIAGYLAKRRASTPGV